MVRIWSFDCSGPGSVPGQGTEMLQGGLKKKKKKAGGEHADQYLQGWWKGWEDPFGDDGDGHSVDCGDGFTDVHIPLVSKLFKLYALNMCS